MPPEPATPRTAPAASATEDAVALVARIGADLKRLENHFKQVGRDGDKNLKSRFPRGYLRTAQTFRERWWFITTLRQFRESLEKWATTKKER